MLADDGRAANAARFGDGRQVGVSAESLPSKPPAFSLLPLLIDDDTLRKVSIWGHTPSVAAGRRSADRMGITGRYLKTIDAKSKVVRNLLELQNAQFMLISPQLESAFIEIQSKGNPHERISPGEPPRVAAAIQRGEDGYRCCKLLPKWLYSYAGD